MLELTWYEVRGSKCEKKSFNTEEKEKEDFKARENG
jgi:hypothetical protein